MSVLGAEANGERSADAFFLPGQLVDGRYRVERLIGVGGMAAVWAGTNERTGKRVALKVILRSLASTPAVRELFYTEGLVASRVNHPNVVTVFDVIEHEGMACMVMELLDGEPLSRLLERKGRLELQEATWLLLPAMRGVAAAHAQGVVHRDLKPQNIFLCVEPNGRIVTTKVLDFGISVLVERVLDLSRGLLVGTPNYMSPEHVAGVAIIDGRADVYGFGVLLYEALTGQMAFPGEAGPTLFHAILNQPAPPLTSQRPDIPSGLASIIERAMAKQPEKRFASLNAMITALEAELLALGLGVSTPSALPGPSNVLVNPSSAATSVHHETMVLYAFPTDAPETKSKARREDLETAAQTMSRRSDTEVVLVRSGTLFHLAGMDWSSRLLWKVGLATVLGVVLGVAAWNATSPSVDADVLKAGGSAETIPVAPTVVPLASPEPLFESVVVESASVAAETGPAEKPMTTEPKKASRGRTALVASTTRVRVLPQETGAGKPRALEREGVSSETGASAAQAETPTKSSATRAGTLSVDEF